MRFLLQAVKDFPSEAVVKRDAGSIPGWERSPGGGNDNPLQYSCLENPWTESTRAWWATVHGVTKSQIRLSDWAHIHTNEGQTDTGIAVPM